ncbi:MAG: TetR/AcrR family transcriptional regulator, partial [Tissierellales bacterium]
IHIRKDVKMNNMTIKKRRVMTYFIEAANEIIKEEGISGITIRKVADKAGFNSATIYNYFENLDHLVLFAAMKHIKEYALALPKYLQNVDNALDRFIKVWECFCYYSFKEPEIYYAIFFANLDKDLSEYIGEYYKLFPEEIGVQPKEVSTMLLRHNIYDRGMALVEECVKEGFIKEEDAEALNEMCTLIYEGILQKVIKNKMDTNEAMNKTMKYINLIVENLINKNKI